MTQVYTFDSDVVSDLHKDAFGFRPKQDFWAEWSQSTDDERQATWDWLLAELKSELARERQQQERAVVRFEALVQRTLDTGAADRDTALRWIMDASGCDGDWEYLCFHHGLPYNYFRKSV